MSWGNGVGESGAKVLVKESARPDAAGAATVAPCLVTAAVPRDLRVDPCEEKSKRDELRRVRQRSVDGRGRGLESLKHDGCYLLLRKRSGEVRKNVYFPIGDAPPSFSHDLPRGLWEYG